MKNTRHNSWKGYTWRASLASIDFFQRDLPGLNIRGKKTISSLAGSILSLSVLLITLFYAANKFSHLLKKSNPSISSFTERGAVTKFDELNLRDAGLRLAFGIEGWNDRDLKDDPRFVKTIVRKFGRLDGKKYEQIIPHRRCEPEDYDKFLPPMEEAIEMLEWYKTDPTRNLLCIDWDELGDDIDIWGNWQDETKYQRFEFLVTPCNYVHTALGYDGDSIDENCIEDL